MHRANEARHDSTKTDEPARTNGIELDLTLDGVERGRRGAHLAEHLRRAVVHGRLAPGATLPSTRELALDLGVSRGVVVDVYERLIAEGYLHAAGGRRGTIVAARAAAPTPTERPETLPRRAGTNPGRPDPALFPRRDWLRAYSAALRSIPDGHLSYGEARGLLALRTELARYLARVRGVSVDPGQVVVVNGFAQGMVCIVRCLAARHGAVRVAVEDPGSVGGLDQLRTWGADVVHVPVDEHGLDTDALESSGAHVALVTPAHQYPSGVTLAPARRLALVDWARRHDAIVVEDDYDAEYRYDRAALTSLHALMPERVITGGSTSKSLSPALRIGWLVAPHELADELADIKATLDLATATLEQAALAELIASGAYDRHLRRTRSIYRARRDAVIAAATRLPGVDGVTGIAAGLHLVAQLRDGVDEHDLAERARAVGLDAQPLSRYRTAPGAPGLVLGFGMATPDALRRGLSLLEDHSS